MAWSCPITYWSRIERISRLVSEACWVWSSHDRVPEAHGERGARRREHPCAGLGRDGRHARLSGSAQHHLNALDRRLQSQVFGFVTRRPGCRHGRLQRALFHPVVGIAQFLLAATIRRCRRGNPCGRRGSGGSGWVRAGGVRCAVPRATPGGSRRTSSSCGRSAGRAGRR